MTPGTVAALMVAKFFGIDPGVVEEWPNPDFLDREEFMFIQMEMDERELDGIGN